METLEQQLFGVCATGDTEQLKQLLNYNSKVNIIKRLFYNTPTININCQNIAGRTPFYVACGSGGHIEIVKLLLNDKRADINQADGFGTTPLKIACYFSRIEIVKLLLNDERIDVNKEDKNGETPFYFACLRNEVEIVKLLLNDKRINVNQADKDVTPFYRACFFGSIEVVKLLLNDQRVDINQADKNGITPFYNACRYGHFEIISHILASGRVNLNIKNKDGKTVIEVIRSAKQQVNHFEGEKLYSRVLELVEAFERDPNETRYRLRKELGLAGNFYFIYFIFQFFNSNFLIIYICF